MRAAVLPKYEDHDSPGAGSGAIGRLHFTCGRSRTGTGFCRWCDGGGAGPGGEVFAGEFGSETFGELSEQKPLLERQVTVVLDDDSGGHCMMSGDPAWPGDHNGSVGEVHP